MTAAAARKIQVLTSLSNLECSKRKEKRKNIYLLYCGVTKNMSKQLSRNVALTKHSVIR